MAFLLNLLFKLAYVAATLGYPAYHAALSVKNNRVDRLWLWYFLVFATFSFLESTILFPVKYM